jgi:phospholipase C
MAKIEHLVVLMFENCSFDRMLGFSRPASPAFAGLAGDEANPVDPGAPPVAPRIAVSPLPFADYEGYVTDPDPHHELSDVTMQVFGGGAPAPGAANNQGFVASYRQIAPDKGGHVMGCFARNQLRALTALADEFLVFDHWHASVPGPTWPNRFFVHCATSGGHSESPSDVAAVGATFPMGTIFELLEAAGKSWRIYYHDVPQALALARLHAHRDHFGHVGAFLEAAAEGTLPSYSFIEPAYFNLPALGIHANDMHPPHDVRLGDRLIADVYNAMRAGPGWNASALLVLWDEHGGFFDHLPPPDSGATPLACAPDEASGSARAFQFDRLGVRVPAILASPLVARGGVDHTLFEHSAVPATLRKLFGLPGCLSKRDAASATFDSALSLSSPRDTPAAISFTETAGPPPETAASDLSGMQRHLLAVANGLDVSGLATDATSSLAGSVVRVARYLDV